MLRLIYRWRYRRAQRAESYKVPSDRKGYGNGQVNLGSYMSQPEVRGRDFDRFDLPNNRRKTIVVALVVLLALLFGWIILESVEALELLRACPRFLNFSVDWMAVGLTNGQIRGFGEAVIVDSPFGRECFMSTLIVES